MQSVVPSWLEPHLRDFANVEVEEQQYQYVIFSHELNTSMGAPSIVAMCHELSEGWVFGVSDTYPEAYRELGVWHEIKEHILHVFEGEEACREVLEQELRLAQEQGFDLNEYIEFRRKFFGDLVQYYRGQDSTEARELLAKLERSYKYLTRLAES